MTSAPGLDRLTVLLGQWRVAIDVPGVPTGRTTFEWMLGGTFLLQRTEIPHPDFPDSSMVVAADPGGETYTQHYFDSRGVARIYRMAFDERSWTLEATDYFQPRDIPQRFVGVFDGAYTIAGAWEHAKDGVSWERDFALSYHRIG